MSNKAVVDKNLIDPMIINVGNSNIENSVHGYQDMFIFVDLKATRRGRTNITNNSVETDNEINVGFIGVNQNKNNNENKYTTNYYYGSVNDNENYYESFGIEKITIKINASYVPQINIVFVDLRGLSFFNQENSKYRILFDFPPPTFTLTLKGYYGGTIEYDLHLIKYHTTFKPENGNFIIDAEFVALTFAPLSDILFRYIVNTKLINQYIDFNQNTTPTNTFLLIEKIRALNGNKILDKTIYGEKKSLDDIDVKIKNINDLFLLLSKYKEDVEYGTAPGCLPSKMCLIKSYALETTVGETKQRVIPVKILNGGIDKYDQFIESNNTAYVRLAIQLFSLTVEQRSQNVKFLYNYRDKLVNNDTIKEFTTKSDFTATSSYSRYVDDIVHTIDIKNWKSDDYYFVSQYLDITDFYVKLKKKKIALENEKKELSNKIVTSINNSLELLLGFKPTIYNVFKIILDDVDYFFNYIKKVSTDAYKHHNDSNNKSIILSNSNEYKDNKKIIYPFPLVIQQLNKSDHRIAPLEISKKCNSEFPELIFVKEFINSFTKQKNYSKIFSMFMNIDENIGKFIPINSYESDFKIDKNLLPYLNCINLNDLIDIILLRFYYISQELLLLDVFYGVNTNYCVFFAEVEAFNILYALKLYNLDLKKTIKNNFKKYETIDLFYSDLNDGNVGNKYYRNNKTPYLYSIYSGATEIYNDRIEIITEGNELETGKSIDVLKKFKKVKTFSSDVYITSENVLFIPDKPTDDDDIVIEGGYSTKTKFFTTNMSDYFFIRTIEDFNDSASYGDSEFFINYYNNKYYYGVDIDYSPINGLYNNIGDYWSKQLALYDDFIYDTLINKNSNSFNLTLSSIIITSLFGTALSPFNVDINNGEIKKCFQISGIVEVPVFFNYYIGSLIHLEKNGSDYNKLGDFYIEVINKTNPYMSNRLYEDFFYNNKFLNSLVFILGDYWKILYYLSDNDKNVFYDEYINFVQRSFNGTDTLFDEIINSLKNVVDTVRNKTNNLEFSGKYAKKYWEYSKYFKIQDSTLSPEFNTIIAPLFKRTNIIVNGGISFKIKERKNSTDYKYTPLSVLNDKKNYKISNKKYFSKLFKIVYESLDTEIKDEEKKNADVDYNMNKINDRDIINQFYYSFKNINDKWLNISNVSTQDMGYPFNVKTGNMIDLFSFVDRTMNPIDDTVINLDILPELFDDPNASVFTVISQLLSTNNFEFFPLQNFMNHKRDDWEKSFKIETNINVDTISTFVCMYIGGTASFPSIPSNQFLNDGIDDIQNTDVSDFNTPLDTTNITKINHYNFPYNQIRGFKVSFAKQNQTMFTSINFDSKEYQETNESIQIMARIANDDKENAPVQKAQNLYNVYENRAYKATVTGLGNAMIQPTQYFQIENIPIFNGAYLILNVEHTIIANKMDTTFSGVKILKYPIPRITESAVLLGYDGTTAEISDDDYYTYTVNRSNNNNNSLINDSKYNNNFLQFNRPLNTGAGYVYISSLYMEKRGNRYHYGIDIAAPKNTEVWAVRKGKIATIGNQNGYGKIITIDHGTIQYKSGVNKKVYTAYAHLIDFADLEVNTEVNAGQLIGWVGNSGGDFGYHLHFEVRLDRNVDNDKNNIYATDPKPFLNDSLKDLWGSS